MPEAPIIEPLAPPPPIPEGPLKNIIEALIAYKKPIINNKTIATQNPDATPTPFNNPFTNDVAAIRNAILTENNTIKGPLHDLIEILIHNSSDSSIKTLIPHYCELILIQYPTVLDSSHVAYIIEGANAK